jgi:hypothetical protein
MIRANRLCRACTAIPGTHLLTVEGPGDLQAGTRLPWWPLRSPPRLLTTRTRPNFEAPRPLELSTQRRDPRHRLLPHLRRAHASRIALR